jgi:CoA:oxalate CoA-transferase
VPEGPLAGLLVVDLSRVLAGPFTAMLLADLGARVVKVERPLTGDDSRAYGPFLDGQSLYFARVNRGKESIALDLKSADGRIVLDALLTRADVVVENFRPGVMGRLGYGPDALAERFPRLVALSLSGFGHTGPWSQRPAYDAVVQAMSGVMSITGPAGGAWAKPGVPIADLSAGLYGAVAALAALRERDLTGRGQHVDVAMFDTTVSLLEGAALRFLATGSVPSSIGNAHFSIAPFDTFACADRDITVCAANDALFGALCGVLGVALAADPRFASNALRHDHRDALKSLHEAGPTGGGGGAVRSGYGCWRGGRLGADVGPHHGGPGRRASHAGKPHQAVRAPRPRAVPGRA